MGYLADFVLRMVVVTSLGPPEEGVRLKVENTGVYINRKQLGMGVLYISEARVSWVGIQGQGFSLEYPHIALHAVSRDLTVFHQECLYLMIDVRLVDEMGTPMSTPTSSDADDRGKLDTMFATMSECQALHPDTDDTGEEEEEADDVEEPGMYDDAEEDLNGGGDGPENMDAE